MELEALDLPKRLKNFQKIVPEKYKYAYKAFITKLS